MKLDKKSITIVFISAFLVQIIVISYNNYTGYVALSGLREFTFRLFFGTIFSFILALLIIGIDIFFINRIDKKYPWSESPSIRVFADSMLALTSAIVISGTITALLNLFFPYKDNVINVIITNSAITAVINIIIVAVIESYLFFRKSQESELKAERLEKENAQIRLELLKSELNPHFLFNSMNTLSALIEKDSEKAQHFVSEFSAVYRYILDVIDKYVVPVEEEINFIKSYFTLQKIRFSDNIELQINLTDEVMESILPPLSFQLLVENAIKHNAISKEKKLFISISVDNNFIVVKNNIIPKISKSGSKGIGLNNLKKRYEYTTEKAPQITVTEEEFIVKLPIMEAE